MKNKRLSLVLSVILTTSLFLSACGTNRVDKTVDKTAEAKVTRTVKDQAGNAITVSNEISKVVDLWEAHNQIMLMLAPEKLAGTTPIFKSLPWANKMFPDVAKLSVPIDKQKTAINMEELMKINPDLVFSYKKDLVETCSKADIPSAYVFFWNYDQLKETVNITAELLGGEKEKKIAKEYNAYLDKNINLVKERLGDIPEDEKLKFYHTMATGNPLKTRGQKSIISEWMKLLGGVNVAEQYFDTLQAELSLEQLLECDPDAIFIDFVGPGGVTKQEALDIFQKDERFKKLKAVKENRIYCTPTGVFAWDRWTGESALFILWAAQTIYPDKFADIDMVQETKYFYKNFCGYDMTDEEAETMLNYGEVK